MNKYLFPVALFALSSVGHAANQSGAARANGAAVVSTVTNILNGAEPGTITAGGITVYGVVDVNYAYQTHGVRPAVSYYNGSEFQITKMPRARKAFVNNGLQTSTVGIRGKQSLSSLTGFQGVNSVSLVFDLQVGLNPLTRELTDNLKTLRQNNGVVLLLQSTNGDGGRARQFFSGDAYGGLKSPVLGDLRFGRNTTQLYDDVSNYDPQKLS